MTLQEYETLSNLLFIVILIFVCSMGSLFTVWLYKKNFSYWIFSTVYFVGISFATITTWYFIKPW